jgi:DNA-binding NarL/FixJ family response regulator
MDVERRSGGDRRIASTVVLIDDEPLVRSAIAQMLVGSQIELVGEAGTGGDGLVLVTDVRPDVVLMDVRLLDVSGIEAIQQLTLLAPASRILVLARSEQNQVLEAILAGASGYILKSAPSAEIVEAIRATAAGESVISPAIAGKLLDRLRESSLPVIDEPDASAVGVQAVLTQRELDIFALLASGASNAQIATDLMLSTNTVANHLKSILGKLHLENRVQVAVHAVRAGFS